MKERPLEIFLLWRVCHPDRFPELFHSFRPGIGYGAYGNLSFTHDRLGVSFEMKDYTNFSIGTGINDPPSLCERASYRLLNRSTHLPDLGS